MALRLRRGTNAERLLITPLQGELIYATDTKKVYVGDGTTVGGVAVDTDTTVGTLSINDLSNVDIASTPPSVGQVLKWDGSKFAPSDDIDTNTGGAGIVEGNNYRISITSGDDSSILVNSDNGQIKGDLHADVYGSDSAVIVDYLNSKVVGPIDTASLEINNIPITTSGTAISVTGGFVGPLDGDITGSVFGDNSTTLVDGVASKIVGPVDNKEIDSGTIVLEGTNSTGQKAGIRINSDGNADDDYDLLTVNNATAGALSGQVLFINSRGTLTSPTASATGDQILNIVSVGYDSGNAAKVSSSILAKTSGTIGSNVVPGTVTLSTANAAGTLTSALELDHTQQATFGGAVKLASYANSSARNTAITSPAAGMMIFNLNDDSTGVPVFQGYDGSAWIDLH